MITLSPITHYIRDKHGARRIFLIRNDHDCIIGLLYYISSRSSVSQLLPRNTRELQILAAETVSKLIFVSFARHNVLYYSSESCCR